MEDRDYFLQQQIDKLTETLNSLIACIVDCKDKNKIDSAIEFINLGMLENLNINIEEVTTIPLEHFIATITIDNIIDNHNLDLLADLFYHTAKAYQILNHKEVVKRLYHRALVIYKFLAKVEIDFPYERHLRIKELNEILSQ
jgi:hypothetical protein